MNIDRIDNTPIEQLEAELAAQGVSIEPSDPCIKARLEAARQSLSERSFEVGTSGVVIPPAFLHPTIVCLCGSTRFMDAFQEANLRETIAGKIVLSIGCNTKSDSDLLALGELTKESKAMLDQLHLRKIDLADEVLILNVGGYVGSSTRNEILYAARMKKQLRWLEPFNIPVDLVRELAEQAFLNWEDLP